MAANDTLFPSLKKKGKGNLQDLFFSENRNDGMKGTIVLIFCPWLSSHLFTVTVPPSLRTWSKKGKTWDPTCIFYRGCAVNSRYCGFYVPGEKKGMRLQARWSAL